MPFLDDFLANLAAELHRIRGLGPGLLPAVRVRNGTWNRYSWLHARVTGAMARSLPLPSVPMLEVKWDGRFKPDLCAVDVHDETTAVIEYESTNSSDERLFGKDLEHFERAIGEYATAPAGLPPWWIIISTLNDGPVTGWPWHGWNRDATYPPSPKSRTTRNASPLAYYEPHLHTEFEATWQRLVASFGGQPATSLVWVNLEPNQLRVMNVNGLPQTGPVYAF